MADVTGAYESADLPAEGELAPVDETADAATDPAIQEDIEAERQALDEVDFGIADEAQPDTQGEEPLDAELGPDGQGDLAPEDL